MNIFVLKLSATQVTSGSTPCFRLKISSTGPAINSRPPFDSDVFLIRREGANGNFKDIFQGICTPEEFYKYDRKMPKIGDSYYRAHSWELVFYSETTMREAATILHEQLARLEASAEAVKDYSVRRSETYKFDIGNPDNTGG